MTEFTEWRSLVDGERISAIPDDQLTQYWPGSEGSGTTVSNSITSVNLSLSQDSWVTGSELVEGAAFVVNNGNRYETDTAINCNDTNLSFGAVLTINGAVQNSPLGMSGDATEVGSSGPDNGWVMTIAVGADNEETAAIRIDASDPEQVITANYNERILLSVSLSDNDGDIYSYNTSGLIDSASFTETRTTTDDSILSGGTNTSDRDLDADIEAVMVSEDTALSQSDWQSIADLLL